MTKFSRCPFFYQNFQKGEKMKLSKIIAIIFALTVSVLTLCLVVSADYSLERQVREEQLEILNKYCKGDVTYDTYIAKSNELTQKLYDESTVSGYISSEAEQIGNMFKGISHKVGATAQIYGDKAYQYIADCIVDYLDDYTALADIESPNNPDMQGYGALAIFYPYADNTDMVFYLYSNSYGTYTVNSNGMYNIYGYGGGKRDYYYRGTFNNSSAYSGTGGFSGYRAQFFGDWRDPNNTEEQLPTDDEFVQSEVLDFSNASDVDLDKLINEISEALERAEPDLSNVEGLLNSIYFRLGQIDSDNDNALLAEINAAILSLANSNNANTAQLILKLDEIKQVLNPEGENENPEEQQPTDLTGVIDELKEINAGIKGLAAIEVVENIWELTEGEQQLFNEYASLIPLIVDKLGIGLVQATMSDIESLIFTSSPPSDLTVEMYGSEYAVLSRDMFNEESLKYINLAKNFVTVLIIYAWCMSMRKKLGGVE